MAAIVALVAGAVARADEGARAELELVREAVEGPVVRSALEAARLRARASGTAAPWAPDPTVELRREQANGPAGASTRVVGGAIPIPTGLPGPAERRAATLRGGAGSAWVRAEAVEAVCAVREAALGLWVADARAARVAAAHGRLEALLAGVDGLARAGEVAGYDRDRLALGLARHRVERDRHAGARADAASALLAWGVAPPGVLDLAPLAPLPTLDQAVAGALAADPVLAALRQEREASGASVAAARRAGLPELALSGGARWDALPDGTERAPGYELGLGLALPLFDRNQVAVREAVADRAALDAALARREAAVRAEVERSWRQAERLGPVDWAVAAEPVWEGARRRYAGGEASIDELLAVAADVEGAELAGIDAVALRRRAHLSLACAAGDFPEIELRTLIEEISP